MRGSDTRQGVLYDPWTTPINEGKRVLLRMVGLTSCARRASQTSFLRALQAHVNSDDALKHHYECIYVSLERIQGADEDKFSVSRSICSRLALAALEVGDQRAADALDAALHVPTPLSKLLSGWPRRLWSENKKSLVILFDEFDNLRGEPLLFVLGELRSGYVCRGDHQYPTTVALCGMRRLRDYKNDKGESIIGTSSPFNVAIGPLHTVPLTMPQVAELYAQHTAATGQRFEADAVERAFYWTQGQPWLVNRIGYDVTTRMAESGQLPATEPVTAAHVDAAVDVMINERSSHLDSLTTVLSEERVHLVLESVLQDRVPPPEIDETYCRELGLLKPSGFEIANPLYAEVLPRALLERHMSRQHLENLFAAHRLVVPETGGFDLTTFLQRFCDFAREHAYRKDSSEHVSERNFELLLLTSAFHSINGAGRVDRQRALGEVRSDITIELPRMRVGGGGRYDRNDERHSERIVLELKVGAKRKKGVAAVEQHFTEEALNQIGDYAQRLGRVDRVALIVFDTNVVALPGTDPRTSVFRTEKRPSSAAYANTIVECYSLHVPRKEAGR